MTKECLIWSAGLAGFYQFFAPPEARNIRVVYEFSSENETHNIMTKEDRRAVARRAIDMWNEYAEKDECESTRVGNN